MAPGCAGRRSAFLQNRSAADLFFFLAATFVPSVLHLWPTLNRWIALKAVSRVAPHLRTLNDRLRKMIPEYVHDMLIGKGTEDLVTPIKACS